MLAAAERQLVSAVKAIADRREGLAKLTGQVDAARTRTQAAADEIERGALALDEARGRAEFAEEQFEIASGDADDLTAGDAEVDERYAAAGRRARAGRRPIQGTRRRRARSPNARRPSGGPGRRRSRSACAARTAPARCSPRPTGCPGLLGSVAALLAVDPGHEAALAAALGGLADAVAVSGVDDVTAAMELLKSSDAGRATLLVGTPATGAPAARPSLPSGAAGRSTWSAATTRSGPALERALHDVVLVDGLAAARDLVAAHPELRAVTPDGDVVGAYAAAGGSAKAQSYIEVQAAVDEARSQRSIAETRLSTLQAQLSAARDEVAARKDTVAAADAGRKAADTARNAAARKLAELGAAARSARAEADRLGAARSKTEAARDEGLARLTELEERLRLAEATPLDADPSTEERDELASQVPAARQNEMEVRLAVRTAEERVGALAGRADALLRQAAAERAARERAAARKAARARGAGIATLVAAGAATALSRIIGHDRGRRRAPGRDRGGTVHARSRTCRGTRYRHAPRRRSGPADVGGAPGRGRPYRAAAAGRAAGIQGGRGLRPRRDRSARRVRAAVARTPDCSGTCRGGGPG